MVLMGIDIGTSSCKTALYRDSGELIGEESGRYRIYYPKPRFVEQDANEWWQTVCESIKNLLEKTSISPSDITAVGIAGQSWSAIPVDKDGEVLGKTPIWMDTRAAEHCQTVLKKIGEDRILSISGNPFSPSYTLPKLLYWMDNEPELVASADKILQSNSFIAYRLTGKISQDYSQTYGWHNYDIKSLKYDEDLTNAFGVDRRFLIEPVASDAIVGYVTPEAQAACGLKQGTPVVAGGLDAACGTLGVGVIKAGQTQEQGGQAGGMSICVDQPVIHSKLILSKHVVPNMWLLQGGTVAGGASIEWAARTLGAKDVDATVSFFNGQNMFETLSREAEHTAPGANGLVFLPYLNGERSPIWDAKAQGMYFGLTMSTTHADMIRAVMEGVAFALEQNLKTAEEAGAVVREMRPMGGSASSHVWTQIKADVTGRRMVVPSADTATTSGAAMLAGVGAGIYKDYPAAVEKFVSIKRTHQPKLENREIYHRYYDIYQSLYTANKDLMHQISDLREGAGS